MCTAVCWEEFFVTKVYGMSTESQGNKALESFISDVGAPYHIHSNNAQMERSKA